METEQQMAEARAYLARLRGGDPVPWEPAGAPPAADATAAPEEPFADDAGIASDGAMLRLAAGPDGFDLRSETGALYGRLTHAGTDDRWAQTASERCLIAFERTPKGWAVVARDDRDDAPIAALHRGWRPGGDVWISPDDWSTLRWAAGVRGSSWRLASGGEEILRLRRTARAGYEIALHGTLARPALAALFVCHVVMTETGPLLTTDGGGSGAWFGGGDWSGGGGDGSGGGC